MEFDDFMKCIQSRVELKRKDSNLYLSMVTKTIVLYWAENEHDGITKDIINQYIHDILNDCEIFCDMDRTKAIDALRECSSLAVIYVNDPDNILIYERITRLVKELMSSYP